MIPMGRLLHSGVTTVGASRGMATAAVMANNKVLAMNVKRTILMMITVYVNCLGLNQ
jgi:hypothetical protein